MLSPNDVKFIEVLKILADIGFDDLKQNLIRLRKIKGNSEEELLNYAISSYTNYPED